LDTAAAVAEFCRARQPYCQNAVPVRQIGLFFSSESYYKNAGGVFPIADSCLNPIKGVLRCLLDSQNPVEIVMDHQFKDRAPEYPLVVLPEWDSIGGAAKEELTAYVKAGGNLLIVGCKAAEPFAGELGISFTGMPEPDARLWLAHDGRMAGVKTSYHRVITKGSTAASGKLYRGNDTDEPSEAACVISPFGDGKIAALLFDVGSFYLTGQLSLVRDFVGGFVRELFPDPLVTVKGSHCVDVAVNRIGGKLAVNLINTAGPHADKSVYVFDEIPPIGPLEIMVRLPEKPSGVKLEPEGADLDFEYRDGLLTLVLPRLEIHSIILIG